MPFPVGLPIIGILVTPIPLSLLVVPTVSPLKIALTQALLLSLAVRMATGFLTETESRVGIEQDGTPGTFCHTRIFDRLRKELLDFGGYSIGRASDRDGYKSQKNFFHRWAGY